MTEELPQEPIATPSEPIATPSEPVSTEFTIPDDYKDKGWAAKVKSPDDLWKALDGAQALIGKKSVVPDFTSGTPEEIESYLDQLRPATPNDYAFPDGTSDDLKGLYGNIMHFAGVHPSRVEGVLKQVQEYEAAKIAEMQSPEKFDEMTKQAFGADWQKKRDSALGFLRTALPENEQGVLEAIPNEALLAMYKVAAFAQEKYGASENGAQAGSNPAPIKVDLAGQADQLMSEIMAENKKQPPDFTRIEQLKQQLKETNNKRAAQ